jgi:hypothetical protein
MAIIFQSLEQGHRQSFPVSGPITSF